MQQSLVYFKILRFQKFQIHEMLHVVNLTFIWDWRQARWRRSVEATWCLWRRYNNNTVAIRLCYRRSIAQQQRWFQVIVIFHLHVMVVRCNGLF